MASVEQQYWEKLAVMKESYEKKMAELCQSVGKCMGKFPINSSSHAELQALHKKLVCMYCILQNTPEKVAQSGNRDVVRLDILEAAEQQIKKWIGMDQFYDAAYSKKK